MVVAGYGVPHHPGEAARRAALAERSSVAPAALAERAAPVERDHGRGPRDGRRSTKRRRNSTWAHRGAAPLPDRARGRLLHRLRARLQLGLDLLGEVFPSRRSFRSPRRQPTPRRSRTPTARSTGRGRPRRRSTRSVPLAAHRRAGLVEGRELRLARTSGARGLRPRGRRRRAPGSPARRWQADDG